MIPDFAARLKEHLARFDLIGVAGTNCLTGGEWASAGPPYIFGQIAQIHPQGGFVVRIFGIPGRSVGQIHAIDGLFFAARRSVVENVRFDGQTFDGFHLYDLDFSYAAHLAGFRLGIVNDIPILHASWGPHDQIWTHYAVRFEAKYANRLQVNKRRPFTFAWVHVRTKQEALEVMKGTYRIENT